MEITEVRIKLMDDSDDRLQAFCSITFDDCFVIRDLKIIDGTNGPFVAMPSRKLTSHCQRCGAKNHLRSGYCSHCGVKLREERGGRDSEGRAKLYADIAHPINSECREMIQNRVIHEFEAEMQRAQEPGYRSRYDEAYGDEGPEFDADTEKPKRAEHAHIEPAEPKIRPPHVPPGSRSQPPASPGQRPRTQRPPQQSSDSGSQSADDSQGNPTQSDDDFGAGIFD